MKLSRQNELKAYLIKIRQDLEEQLDNAVQNNNDIAGIRISKEIDKVERFIREL